MRCPWPCTRQAKPGLPWEVWPLEAIVRGPDHLTTNCGLNLLTAATAATCLINTMAEVTATVVCGVSVRNMRAESAIAPHARCLARVLLVRVRRPFARCLLFLVIIQAAIDIYSARCARGCAAHAVRVLL